MFLTVEKVKQCFKIQQNKIALQESSYFISSCKNRGGIVMKKLTKKLMAVALAAVTVGMLTITVPMAQVDAFELEALSIGWNLRTARLR